MAGKLFENSAGNLVTAFGGLIGIRCGTEGDRLMRLHTPQFVPQQIRGVLLHVNLLLEVHAVPHFHEFVRVARIAVAASELASAVGIDRPGKWHLTFADAPVEQRLGREGEILDVMPFPDGLTLRGQARDTDQFGLARKREQRQGGHKRIRLLFAYRTARRFGMSSSDGNGCQFRARLPKRLSSSFELPAVSPQTQRSSYLRLR